MARRRSKGVLPSSAEAELAKAKQVQSDYGYALMCLETWEKRFGGRTFNLSRDKGFWKITLISLRVKDHIIEEKSVDLQAAIDEAVRRFG